MPRFEAVDDAREPGAAQEDGASGRVEQPTPQVRRGALHLAERQGAERRNQYTMDEAVAIDEFHDPLFQSVAAAGVVRQLDVYDWAIADGLYDLIEDWDTPAGQFLTQ